MFLGMVFTVGLGRSSTSFGC